MGIDEWKYMTKTKKKYLLHGLMSFRVDDIIIRTSVWPWNVSIEQEQNTSTVVVVISAILPYLCCHIFVERLATYHPLQSRKQMGLTVSWRIVRSGQTLSTLSHM